jgi:hypothetical protein
VHHKAVARHCSLLQRTARTQACAATRTAARSGSHAHTVRALRQAAGRRWVRRRYEFTCEVVGPRLLVVERGGRRTPPHTHISPPCFPPPCPPHPLLRRRSLACLTHRCCSHPRPPAQRSERTIIARIRGAAFSLHLLS